MKIAFSTSGTSLEGALDPRFGRAARFLVYDQEEKSAVVLENAAAQEGQGAGLRAAEAVVKAGASVVVTGACGPKAFSALRQAKVRVFLSKASSVAAALAAFEAGSLEEMSAA